MLEAREYTPDSDDEDILPDNITETESESEDEEGLEEEYPDDEDLEEAEEDGPPDTL